MVTKPYRISLFSVIVDLKYVFSRFKVEKGRSDVAIVTGRVVNICNGYFILSTMFIHYTVRLSLNSGLRFIHCAILSIVFPLILLYK